LSLPVLYSFRRCPYAIRARMALHYAGIELEHREILLKDKPPAMLSASAKGTVPVLVLDHAVIDESIDVMHWALAQHDPHGWLAQSLQHELIQENDSSFKYNLDRYKYFERYPEQSQQTYLSRCMVFLEKLESSLVEANGVGARSVEARSVEEKEFAVKSTGDKSRFFLLNPSVSVLDIAIFPFIRQLAFVDKIMFDGLELPKLHVWLDAFLNSPLFLSIMEKHPLWHADLA